LSQLADRIGIFATAIPISLIDQLCRCSPRPANALHVLQGQPIGCRGFGDAASRAKAKILAKEVFNEVTKKAHIKVKFNQYFRT